MIWKDINLTEFGGEDYTDLYKISTQGDILKKDKLVSKYKAANGKYKVYFYKNGRKKSYLVHILLAQCFLKDIKWNTKIEFKDNDFENININNLEYNIVSRKNIVDNFFQYDKEVLCPICQKKLLKKFWKDTGEWIVQCRDCRYFIHSNSGEWDFRIGDFSTWVKCEQQKSKLFLKQDIKKIYRFFTEIIQMMQMYKFKQEIKFFQE